MKQGCEALAEELFDLYSAKNAVLIEIVATLELVRGKNAEREGDMSSRIIGLAKETKEFFERKNVSELERVWIVDFALHRVFFTLFAVKQEEAKRAQNEALMEALKQLKRENSFAERWNDDEPTVEFHGKAG